MRIDVAIEAFLDHRRLQRRSPNTIARYRAVLEQWQRWRSGRQLTDDLATVEIDDFRHHLSYLLDERVPHTNNPRRPATTKRGMAPASVHGARNVLRAFWSYLADEELLTEQQARFFRGDRIPRPQVEETEITAWDDELVRALLAACEGQSAEEIARNRAIILLLYESGLRLDELCRLTDEQCDFDDRSARIVGKGRKKRWVFWGERAAVALIAYCRLRRGPDGGPLFRGTSWRNNGGQMTPNGTRGVLKRLAQRAGVTLPQQAPVHAGRHAFAQNMIDGGAEISEVSQLLGHADVKTTMRYLRLRKEKLQAAHRRAARSSTHNR